LGHSVGDLIKTNITLSDFNGQTSEVQGVLSVDLTCLIQWDGDEVEVVHEDDSVEVSHAAMSVWDAED
jgi:hypothetical protein